MSEGLLTINVPFVYMARNVDKSIAGSLLRVCICYNVSSLFLSFPLITIIVLDKSGLACCLFCTKSGWRCICNFSLPLPYNLHSPPANRKQGPIPDAMS
jgi:hypothetical protein